MSTSRLSTTVRKSSNDLAEMFYARADEFGVARVSAKQVEWIMGVYEREHRSNSRATSGHSATRFDVGGKLIELVVYPNGGGFFKPA